MTKAADDYESIARHLKELEAEKQMALTGSTLPTEESKPPGWFAYGIGADYDPA